MGYGYLIENAVLRARVWPMFSGIQIFVPHSIFVHKTFLSTYAYIIENRRVREDHSGEINFRFSFSTSRFFYVIDSE